MSEYKLKTGKVGEKVVDTYKKIEESFTDSFLEKKDDGENEYTLKTGGMTEKAVGAYKAVEDSVVGGYKKIEEKFIDAFLEEVSDESVPGNNDSVKTNVHVPKNAREASENGLNASRQASESALELSRKTAEKHTH